MQSNNYLLTRLRSVWIQRYFSLCPSGKHVAFCCLHWELWDLSRDRELSEGRHDEVPASPGIWMSWAKFMQYWEGTVQLLRSQKCQRCLHSPSLAKAKPQDRCSENPYSASFSSRWNWNVHVVLAFILLNSGNFKAPIHQRKDPWIFPKHSVAFPLLIFLLACWAYS